MNFLLDRGICDLLVLARTEGLNCRNGTTVASDKNAASARVSLYDIASFRQGESLNDRVFLQVEDGQEIVSFADEESTALLRCQSHAVISAAACDGVLGKEAVVLGIDDREALSVLQIDVNKFCNRIVLRHPGFAVEMESLDDGVSTDVNYGFRFAALIGNVEFVKWS